MLSSDMATIPQFVFLRPSASRIAPWTHRLLAKSAQIALRNSNRFISLQTPNFASRPESYTCKLPGGYRLISQLKVRMPMECLHQPSAAGKVACKSKKKIMELKQTPTPALTNLTQ